MDYEFIRFRIDPAIHKKAADACSRLGIELNDVLRALVTRIARDSSVPFDLGAAPPRAPERTPFHDYDPRLWASLKPRVDAEAALSLLMRYIADCTTRIDEEVNLRHANQDLLTRLDRERMEARRLLRAFDASDTKAIDHILETYGALLNTDKA